MPLEDAPGQQIETESRTKPQLHQSQVRTLSICGLQYFYRYVEGLIVPPSVALVTGTATHASVEGNLRHKMAEGVLLDADQAADIARDSLNARWGDGILLSPDEQSRGESAIKGEAVDQAVALSVLHHKDLAPTIEPISIERTFRLVLKNYPVDIVGTMDIEEMDAVRDTKTYARNTNQYAVDRDLQLSLYGLAKKTFDGDGAGESQRLHLDVLLKHKKPKSEVFTTHRTEEDYRVALDRVDRAVKVIESGAFMPAMPDHWACSEKFCGYWQDVCPFGRRARTTVSLTVAGQPPE